MNGKGIGLGLMSGVLWGMDTAINSLLLLSVPFILTDSRLISGALLLAFFHDFISADILLVDLLIRRELKQSFKVLKTRSAKFLMLAALFAGPVGMRSYLYAVETIGSGLTATISSLYPALAAICGALLLKDYLNKRGWIGLGLIILSIAILGFSQFSLHSSILMGILAALLCVFGWASESVITAYGMQEDIVPKQALLIRQCTSSLAYFILMVFEGDLFFSFRAVVTSPNFGLVCIIGLIGTLSYFCYYSSIDRIGPVKATGLNVTYSIWTAIFSLFLGGSGIDIRLILCGFLIIFGSSLMLKE
ncbi:DMT family transporter [Streptococcus danieliae]|uniref:DMT family transporter n=1 Tax=Streptococcus danieliae TaxID=747656 RepID=UPI0021CA33CB|nr:DMT family transporter [Streptococcus danieliae]MCU0082024.1 DMT family transporter [Streptococcus danieliae]